MVHLFILFVLISQAKAQLLLKENLSKKILTPEQAKIKFKSLDFDKIELTDLNYKPLRRPAYTNMIVHLWQIDCTGCTASLRANWKNRAEIWINLDRTSTDVIRARDFLKHEKITITSYYDIHGNIRQQMGKFILPKKLLVKNSKVIEVLE